MKIALNDLYLLFLGLFLGLFITEIIKQFIPYISIFGITIGTGTFVFVLFLLLTIVGNLIVKGYRKFVAKFANDVKKELKL